MKKKLSVEQKRQRAEYANGTDDSITLEKFSKDFKIENLLLHSTRVDIDLFKRIVDFSSKKERKVALDILNKTIEEKIS